MLLSFTASDIFSCFGPVVFLYPEIHYVFKYFPFNRYRRKEPEIIADAPYRLEPGLELPVLLLVKDADKFPVFLKKVSIALHAGTKSDLKQFEIDQNLDSKWWKNIFYVSIPNQWRGQTLEVDVKLEYQILGKPKILHNDNLPGLSHNTLKVYAAANAQLSFENWIQGDLHFHTNYTEDQVEFGAPMDASVTMAHAVGLKFFAATDHSYDLDDLENDFLHNDPELKKWRHSRQEINTLNDIHKNKMVILPGEEVSCANEEGRNVHCLVINDNNFLPGSGDCAERWFRTDAELTISDLAEIVSSSGIVIAAHPKDPVPLLEKILIRRGIWADEDCRLPGVAGLQILNGLDNDSFRSGLRQWKRQLLRGERVFIYAGNDAHGNFNRYRQVKTLMMSLHELENHQPFGWARTYVWMGNHELNVENIVGQLRRGHAVISTGPIVVFTIQNEDGKNFQIGETAKGTKMTLRISGRTNDEIGKFSEIKILAGKIGSDEVELKSVFTDELAVETSLEMNLLPYSYLRCEAKTSTNLFCYTNPIWLNRL